VYSISLYYLQHKVIEKNSGNPSVIFSLLPGDEIWERPKEMFATPFIQSIVTKIIFIDQLTRKTDFLSNIDNGNVACTFIGKVYEVLIHAKIFQGNFKLMIKHLPKATKTAKSTLCIDVPTDFEIFSFESIESLAKRIRKIENDKTDYAYYFKPLHPCLKQIDSVVMIRTGEVSHRFLLQMTISSTHRINEVSVVADAHAIWGNKPFKYIYIVPPHKVEAFQRQLPQTGTEIGELAVKPSTGVNPATKPRILEQYVAGVGGQKGEDWMHVEFIDKLMVKVEEAFVDSSRDTLQHW
jgi:hypothetical protein